MFDKDETGERGDAETRDGPQPAGSAATAPAAAPAGQPAAEKRIPSFRAFREIVREDAAAHRGEWFRPGLQALFVYRYGVWVDGLDSRWIRFPLRLLYHVMRVFCRNVYGIELYFTARIGRRFHIGHQNGIVIHYFAEIGDDCTVLQGVTIGGVGEGVPVVGNRVVFGPGSVAAGNIRIGDDVRIAPNAVVLTNVPAGAIVAPPQSRIMAPPPRRAAPGA